MSSEQPRRRETGGSPASPIGSTAAILIAIVAVVGGFLILREIRDDDTAADGPVATLPATTLPVDSTIPPLPESTTTTEPALVVEGATAVVANASTVNGAAGQLTIALAGQGFTLAQATNSAPGEKREESVVYYDESNPAALNVATSIARLMGSTVTVQPLPTPPPVETGSLAEGVTVLVMLGSDKAGSKLEEMASGTTTTAAPGATAPALDTTTTTG